MNKPPIQKQYEQGPLFTEEDKLKDIASFTREIDNTGYAFASNKRKFRLNSNVKL